MSRPVLRRLGAATFFLLALVPVVANASENDFLGVGKGATVTVSEPSTLLLVGVAFLMFAKRARRNQHRREI
jgi:hypothetical protein